MNTKFSLITPFILITLIIVSFYSCGNDDNPITPGSQRCDRDLAFGRNTSVAFPADSFFAVYRLNVTGDVTIESYRYQSASGAVDITGVTSPHTFLDTIFFAQGDTAFLSYRTNIRNGSVTGSVNVFKFGTSLSSSDSCHYSGN